MGASDDDTRTQEAAGRHTVMLDLGGVVCRFSPVRRLDAVAQASGLSAEEVHHRLFASGFDQDCDRGRYGLQEQCDQIRRRLGVSWDEALLAELWAQAFEPDRHVLEIVDRLRAKAGIALLTNNGPLVHLVIEKLLPDVVECFDQLCFSYQVGALKPEPAAYLATLERLDSSPGQCVFVDDTERNVEGARAVGIDAFCFVSADALAGELHDRGLM